MTSRKWIFRRNVTATPDQAPRDSRHPGSRPGRATRRRLGRRGSMAAVMAVSIPALVIVGGWAVDQAYVYYRYQLLEHTAAAAALAGHTELASYITAGGTYSAASMATINSAVSTTVSANMPSARYGSVVPTSASNTTSAVQLGTWDPTAKAFTATTTNPNAVQVTAFSTSANGNAVKTLFGGMVGKPSVDMTASAVSSYGNGLSNAGGFNTIILNDLSQSFSSEMANQRAADNAILNCISAGTNGNGSVGLTSFDGDPYMWNPTAALLFPIQLTYVATPYVPYSTTSYANTLVKATSTNVATMATYINGTFNYCGTTHGPPCTGSKSRRRSVFGDPAVESGGHRQRVLQHHRHHGWRAQRRRADLHDRRRNGRHAQYRHQYPVRLDRLHDEMFRRQPVDGSAGLGRLRGFARDQHLHGLLFGRYDRSQQHRDLFGATRVAGDRPGHRARGTDGLIAQRVVRDVLLVDGHRGEAGELSMLIVTTHHRPQIALAAGVTAGAGGAAGKKGKGTGMALSMKVALVAIMAIAVHAGASHAQSTDSQDSSAQSPDTTSTDPGSTTGVDPALTQNSPDGTPYQYGVFREVVPTAPVSQRNCWVQGLISGQSINGDLLTERVSLTQAQCVLTYLDQRGLCANQRITAYWSARQDNTTTGDSSNWQNHQGSNNWQNNNGQSANGQSSNGTAKLQRAKLQLAKLQRAKRQRAERQRVPGRLVRAKRPELARRRPGPPMGPEQRRHTEQRWLAGPRAMDPPRRVDPERRRQPGVDQQDLRRQRHRRWFHHWIRQRNGNGSGHPGEQLIPEPGTVPAHVNAC